MASKAQRALQRSQATVDRRRAEHLKHVGDQQSAIAPQSPQEIIYNEEHVWSGPLPPPEVLASYNAVVPNAADRILKMAEDQATHRRTIESAILEASAGSQERGQWFALIFGLALLAASVYLVTLGLKATGVTMILLEVVGGAAIFIYAKRRQRKKLEDRRSKADG